MANRLIDPPRRKGALLDIGCGLFPTFLTTCEFSFKIGTDKVSLSSSLGKSQNISFVQLDIDSAGSLPFACGSFDTITMLAVLEHIPSNRATALLSDIEKLLKPGGALVITTPAAWTQSLLRVLAAMKVVSAEEIEDHKVAYTRQELRDILIRTFPGSEISVGYFEGFVNLWGMARKRIDKKEGN